MIVDLMDLIQTAVTCTHEEARGAWWCPSCGARRDAGKWRRSEFVDELAGIYPPEPPTRKDTPKAPP